MVCEISRVDPTQYFGSSHTEMYRKIYRLLIFQFFIWNICFDVVLTARRDDFAPRIIEHPQNTIVQKGFPATLNCRAEGRPEPEITWIKDGESMEDLLEDQQQPDNGDDSRSLVSAVSIGDLQQLFFLRVNRPYVGSYQCVAANRLGTVKSKNATLEVAFLRDDFRTEPVSSGIVTGSVLVLECDPPRGYPPPTVRWMKDEMMIEPDDRRELLTDGNLMISEVRIEDAGAYTCTASNMIGSKVSRSADIDVRAKPTFISSMEDTTAAPGESAVLRCVVEGDPEPLITWTRSDDPDFSIPGERFSIMDDNSLRINEVDILDEGVYSCTAENIWGTTSADLTLTVSAEVKFIDIPADQTVARGQVARLPCKATGSPPPSLVWERENSQDRDMLFPGNSMGRLFVTPEATLEITDVRDEDAGHYVCRGIGGNGMPKARAYLRVISSLETPPPIIRYGPHDQTLIEETLAIFNCQTAGSPPPKVRWSKDSRPLAPSEPRFTVLTPSNNLQISDVQKIDTGVYTCIASNGSGETAQSAYLSVIERVEANKIPVTRTPDFSTLPSAPGAITVSNVSRSSVGLTWSKPSRSRVAQDRSPEPTHYRVEYFCHDMGPGWQIMNDTIIGESYTVRYLRPESTYMFQVRAVNVNGIGPPSPVSEAIRTSVEEISLPVLSQAKRADLERRLDAVRIEVTALGLSGTAITVQWQPNINQNIIEGYYIKYRPNNAPEEYTVEKVMGTDTHIITGLKATTQYSITIQPFQYIYFGVESQPELVLTLSDDEAPIGRDPDDSLLHQKLQTCGILITNVDPISSTALKVMWKVERNEAYIDGYHIKYNQASSEQPLFETVTGQKMKPLTGLIPYTEYNIRVQPFKRSEMEQILGPWSDSVTKRTGEDKPSAPPRQIEAVSNGSHTALISWRAPSASEIPGKIAGYNIFCQGNSTNQHRNKTVKGNVQQAKVTGLLAGKTYMCNVSAFTTAGTGPAVSSRVYIKQEEVPSIKPGGAGTNFAGQWYIMLILIFLAIIGCAFACFCYRRRRKQKETTQCKTFVLTACPIARDNQNDLRTSKNAYINCPTDNQAMKNLEKVGKNHCHSSVNNQDYSKDYTEAQNFQNAQLNSNHTGGQAAWTDQTWPPHQTPEGQPPGHIHPGNRGCMTTRPAIYDKTHQSCQYLQPNGGNPAYWLLEAYADPQDGTPQRVGPPPDNYCVQQEGQPRFGTLRNTTSTFGNVPQHQTYGSTGPEYAVVENDDDECMGPHSCHTLPLQRCPNHIREQCMMAHPADHCEPYASTTLVLPPNMGRGCMGRGPPCNSNSSSSDNSGSHTGGGRCVRCHAVDNQAYSGSGGSAHQNGEPEHMCSDCNTMQSDHGIQGDERGSSRRKHRGHRGSGKQQQPARNWTELLPPPPEQPPTDLDSPPGSPRLAHQNPHCKSSMPGGQHHNIGRPLPEQPKVPISSLGRGGVCNGEVIGPMPPGTIQHYGSLPRKPNQQHMHPAHNGMPMEQSVVGGAIQNGAPTDNLHNSAGTALSHKVFEDPRHEQLGKELLEFNDDMSQSEMMSDPEEETPMLAGHTAQDCSYLPALSEVSDIENGKDDDTDVESNPRCTDSMLAAWSTNSSNRDSCGSTSSDGSFYTDADFASAVAAAAESAGMQVVGSTIVDPKNGKKPKTRSKPRNNGQYQPPRQQMVNGHIAQPNGQSPQQVQQQYIQQLQQLQQQQLHHHQQQQDPSNIDSISKPPYPPVLNNSLQNPGGKHPQDREGNVTDHVLLQQDTNEMGLRVTANPMAFEAEKSGAF